MCLKFDLHVHSKYSKHPIWGRDSFNTPKDIIKKCKENNLTGVAITDHNNLDGALKIKREVEKSDVIVIPGSEIKTDQGRDIIGLWIQENIEPNLSAEEIVDEIHEQGGIAIAPHPFSRLLGIGSKVFDLPLDAIEVFNSRCGQKLNEKAEEACKKLEIGCVGGSDAHIPQAIGNAYTIFNQNNLEIEIDSLLKDIRERRTKVEGVRTPYHIILYLYLKKISYLPVRVFNIFRSI